MNAGELPLGIMPAQMERRFCLSPVDIVLVRGHSDVANAVLFFQSLATPGPDAWVATHVAWVVESGWEDTAKIAEALERVRVHGLMQAYAGSGQQLLIVRPINVPMDARLRIARNIAAMEGRMYGVLKIVCQAIDAVLSFVFRRNIHLARRLCVIDGMPICSTLGTTQFEKEGLNFGIPARSANPYEIQRFALANPDKYAVIFFGTLEKEAL